LNRSQMNLENFHNKEPIEVQSENFQNKVR